jgi:hypothetical protein
MSTDDVLRQAWEYLNQHGDKQAHRHVDGLAAAGLLADPDALARAKAEALREARDEVLALVGHIHPSSDLRFIHDQIADLLDARADRIDPTEGTRG